MSKGADAAAISDSAAMPAKPLHGRVAVLTGSTGGLGFAIAEELAFAGCRIMLNGLETPVTVERMRAACQASGKTCEFVIYPDTPHAFNADYRPSYREGPAKDAWARMLAWFRSHGVV